MCLKHLIEQFCLRFEFVSYSDTYADYLSALETPQLLLPYVLTTPAKINITRPDEGDEYTWQFITGQLRRKKLACTSALALA